MNNIELSKENERIAKERIETQKEITKFIRDLRFYKLTKQQIKVIRGQALAGDLEGAKKGLENLTAVKI